MMGVLVEMMSRLRLGMLRSRHKSILARKRSQTAVRTA